MLAQLRYRPDAGTHQDQWRSERAGRENDFAPCGQCLTRILPGHFHTGRDVTFQDHTIGLHAGQDRKVLPATHGIEKRGRRRDAIAVLLRHLPQAKAVLLAAVEIRAHGNLQRGRRLEQHTDHAVERLRRSHIQFAALPMNFRVGEVLVVLRAPKVRQHVLIRPAGVSHRRPFIVVGRMPAHVDHAVDRARSAERMAMRHQDGTARSIRLRDGLLVPTQIFVRPEADHAERHVDEWAAVRRTGLDQTDGNVGIGTEPVRKYATCGTRTDDNIVEFAAVRRHRASSLSGNLSLFARTI